MNVLKTLTFLLIVWSLIIQSNRVNLALLLKQGRLTTLISHSLWGSIHDRKERKTANIHGARAQKKCSSLNISNKFLSQKTDWEQQIFSKGRIASKRPRTLEAKRKVRQEAEDMGERLTTLVWGSRLASPLPILQRWCLFPWQVGRKRKRKLT